MILIVGLGNPGAEYALTRHNVGWMLLERFVKASGLPEAWLSQACAGTISEGVFEGKEIRALFPHTYMNLSGGAVKKCARKNLDATTLVVVHDDIDLPLGTVRVSYDRGGGGHNGVKSIIDTLGTTKFIRVRIGIAKTNLFGTVKRPTGEALSKFVLAEFTKRERVVIDSIEEKVIHALELCVSDGPERAMQECN